jgi:Transposase
MDGILAYFDTTLTSEAIEAVNGVIQLAKRMARGFADRTSAAARHVDEGEIATLSGVPQKSMFLCLRCAAAVSSGRQSPALLTAMPPRTSCCGSTMIINTGSLTGAAL